MHTKLILHLLAVSLIVLCGQTALAQTQPDPPPIEEEDEQDEDEQDEEAEELDVPETKAPPAPPIPQAEPEVEDDFDSPISDLAGMGDDVEFVPLEEIEEGLLEQISPIGLYPFVDINGWFRVRTRYNVNFDLGTGGTSLVLPPVETIAPTEQPADTSANGQWTTDLRLRLEPTLHITENLRVHIEADLLRNVILGSGARHEHFGPVGLEPGRRLGSSAQLSPPEVLQINEAYGEVDAFFGTVAAGRMDNHWGLGMFTNDGDCFDCDWGDNIDRVMYRTSLWNFYGMAAIDFPSEGVFAHQGPLRLGRPYDLSQADDSNQYTLSLFRAPLTRQDRELQAQTLFTDRDPVINGGLYFSYRTQAGQSFGASDPLIGTPNLVYRGLSLYMTDLWLQFLYEPADNRSVRVELEAVGILGSVDNITNAGVGVGEGVDGQDTQAINCFDQSQRDANLAQCTAPGNTSNSVSQFGLALETEFKLGGPVSFGINGGFATGGSTPNWGYAAETPDLAFYRFNPDYHVDLILFREIIGTVTNAYYVNPYVTASFLEVGNRRMELQFDVIASRAFDSQGAPGLQPWLGLELDASARFVLGETFLAAIDGGLLFPFAGLGAVGGQPRLASFAGQDFTDPSSASLAWTLQGRLVWGF
ncbi:MAG: TIGR04551 family protein [Bradymonadaceae bacterium]|nr:TIGR04551 family protein [Lujinxingiaceae bacterium]